MIWSPSPFNCRICVSTQHDAHRGASLPLSLPPSTPHLGHDTHGVHIRVPWCVELQNLDICTLRLHGATLLLESLRGGG